MQACAVYKLSRHFKMHYFAGALTLTNFNQEPNSGLF